jgi:hypothetical protein
MKKSFFLDSRFSQTVSLNLFSHLVQEIVKYIKLHVLCDFGDILVAFQKIFKKSIFRVIEQKFLFLENLM